MGERNTPGTPFNYEDPYQVLISNNQEVTDFSRILLMYASISLFLTLFGLFGITHYAIQQRIREIRNSEDSRCIHSGKYYGLSIARSCTT